MLPLAILLPILAMPMTLASPFSGRNMVVHERMESVPAGFVFHGAAPKDEVLKLRLALVQSNPAGLQEALMSVSTPNSPLYGKFLSKEETEKFVAPSPESLDAITSFLAEHDLCAEPLSPAGDWLSFNVTVAQANQMFDTDFRTFKHTGTGKTTVRTLQYSIPAALQGHLDFVHPTTTFPQHLNRQPVVSIPLPKPVVGQSATGNLSTDAVPASCAQVVTPACLQALYGIPTARATQTSNVLAVSGFIDQFANQADLRLFLENLRPDISPTTTFALQTLDGGSNPQGINVAGVEANLDIQYTIGVASGVPVVFISVGDNSNDGLFGFLDIANFLLEQANPPHVFTTSYGANENGISLSLANKLCNAYAQLGARGTSVLFASGDGGVSGSQAESCSTFVPTFPSGCPFLTSVGATTGIGPEVAATFSSGGFSNYFGVPDYQKSATASYLAKLGSTNSGRFNSAGRGFPDIAAQGVNVEIAYQGEGGLVDGTSCSSPIFASIVSLLNDELIAAGRSPLGFLNPFLYSTGSKALTSVTSGSNPGCGTIGFPATAGWDPVTGLGTPNFAALRAAVGL